MTTSVTLYVAQPGVALGTSLAAVITAPANSQVTVKRAVFANYTGGAVSFSVSRVASGGSALVIIPSRSIAAGATDLAPELANMVLNAGDVIQALASAATSINVFASGLLAS